MRWLEREQQRDTCWHRTKTLASSPYNYVFLRQPWTRDGIAIPASRSRSQDVRPPTTGPRIHRCLKPGHDSTSVDSIASWGAGGRWGSLDHLGLLKLPSLASKLQHMPFPHCGLPLAFPVWQIRVPLPGLLVATPPSWTGLLLWLPRDPWQLPSCR